MPSYQDIEQRLITLEHKVELVMQVASVTKREPSTLMPGEMVSSTITLAELYREIGNAGGQLQRVGEETV